MGDEFFTAVMPSPVVFGVGLAAVITPITATVLASVDPRHAGIASGVNNVLSRLGQLLAVAVLPLAAGLSGADFQNAAAMADGFPIAMRVAAAASFAAAALAWTMISDDALRPRVAGAKPLARRYRRASSATAPWPAPPLIPARRQPTHPARPAAGET
jgi:hypothetical protein